MTSKFNLSLSAKNLADTIYVSLYSTSASSLEIVPPSQNEITVQGGGGIESTEIKWKVRAVKKTYRSSQEVTI